MSTKQTRNGGKFNGKHTTLTKPASIIADIANQCEAVYKISLDIIESGLSSTHGQKRLKIKKDTHHILLVVRGGITTQQLYAYSKDIETATAYIAKEAKEQGFIVSAENQ